MIELSWTATSPEIEALLEELAAIPKFVTRQVRAKYAIAEAYKLCKQGLRWSRADHEGFGVLYRGGYRTGAYTHRAKADYHAPGGGKNLKARATAAFQEAGDVLVTLTYSNCAGRREVLKKLRALGRLEF